jgi:hypothetical protein
VGTKMRLDLAICWIRDVECTDVKDNVARVVMLSLLTVRACYHYSATLNIHQTQSTSLPSIYICGIDSIGLTSNPCGLGIRLEGTLATGRVPHKPETEITE